MFNDLSHYIPILGAYKIGVSLCMCTGMVMSLLSGKVKLITYKIDTYYYLALAFVITRIGHGLVSSVSR